MGYKKYHFRVSGSDIFLIQPNFHIRGSKKIMDLEVSSPCTTKTTRLSLFSHYLENILSRIFEGFQLFYFHKSLPLSDVCGVTIYHLLSTQQFRNTRKTRYYINPVGLERRTICTRLWYSK